MAELFIDNAVFSPRQQTVLVAALEEMRETADRGAFVRFAVPTHEPELVVFRQRMAQMYAGHSRNVGRIVRFLPVDEFVVARTAPESFRGRLSRVHGVDLDDVDPRRQPEGGTPWAQ